MPKPSFFSRITTGKTDLSLFVCVAIIPLSLVLLLGRALFSNGEVVLSDPNYDLALHFLPWREYLFSHLRNGSIPFWDPYSYGGIPCFADVEAATFYPLGALFFFVSPANAANWTIFFHLLLTGLFTFLWLLHRRSSPLAALLGACLFMLGGGCFLHLGAGHFSNLCTICWIPLILLALDGWRENLSPKWLFLGILAVTMELLAGHIQYFYYSFITTFLYALGTCSQTRKKGLFLTGFLSFFAAAAFLGAIQLLPALAANQETLRGQGMSFEQASSYSMPWECLATLILPNLFGDMEHYLGRGFFSENSLYIGAVGFWVILLGILPWKDGSRKLLATMAAFSLLMALGSQTPLYGLFYHWAPLYGDFRGVSKFNIFTTLFLAALIAAGADSLLARKNVPSRTWGVVMVVSGWAALFASLTLLRISDALPNIVSKGLASGNLVEFGLFSLLLGGSILVFPKLKNRPLSLLTLVAALGLLEIFLFARANVPTFSHRGYQARLQALARIRSSDPGDYRVLAHMGDQGTSILPDLWGVNPMVLDRYARLIAATQGVEPRSLIGSWNGIRNWSPLLGLFRYRYEISERPKGLIVVRTHLPELPRAQLVGRYEVVNEPGLLERMGASDFDPRRTVLLEKEPFPQPAPSLPKGTVALRDVDPDHLEIDADLKAPAILLIGENYAKDWTVRPLWDDAQKDFEVLPADLTLRAVPLAAGHHHLSMEYRPRSFDLGKWISMAALLAYGILLGVWWRSKRTA